MIEWEKEVSRYHDVPGLTPKRVDISKDQTTMSAVFTCAVFPEADHERAVYNMLRGLFPHVKVNVRLSCPALLKVFIASPQDYGERIIERYAEELVGLLPFLSKAEWQIEGRVCTLRLTQNAGSELLMQRDFPNWLSRRLEAIFGEAFEVALSAPDDLEETLKRLAVETAQYEEELAKLAPRRKEKPVGPKLLLGKLIRSQPVAISELIETSGRVTVAGEVISVEMRETKQGGSRILEAAITDYTGSVGIKTFLPADGPPIALKQGDGVMVRGDFQYDKYSRDHLIALLDMQTHDLARRKDEAEEKRLELHCHTQMSVMDGIAPVGTLIERAAKWGHPAIAITDHGVTQAFPEAFAAAKKHGIKLIPGMEGYLVDDAQRTVRGGGQRPLSCDVVVFDLETTGLSPKNDAIVEIGAVRLRGGEIVDQLTTYADPRRPIPAEASKISGITDDMVAGAPSQFEAVTRLLNFIGDAAVAAHNAAFDVGFVSRVAEEMGRPFTAPVIDTVLLSRALVPQLSQHNLKAVCRHFGVKNERHHRAAQDARATAEVYVGLRALAEEAGARTLDDLEEVGDLERRLRSGKSHHIILLARNRQGLVHLNQIVSEGHLRYFQSFPPQPRIPKGRLSELRDGLIIGSACAEGELIAAMRDDADEATLERIAGFYDYLEIQPIANNDYLVRTGEIADEEGLMQLNRRVVALGDKLDIPVCGTGDVHFLEPHDAVLREIIMTPEFPADAHLQAPLYLRTTDEMLEAFAYLGEETARRVVIEAPRALAESVEDITLFPVHPQGLPTFQPTLEGAEDEIDGIARRRVVELYGDELPDIVQQRLDRELSSILGNGFATLYCAAMRLVKRSVADGYMVGSRGSVGSSFAAYLLGITEVNPLAPHYRCPACRFSDFDVDTVAYPCGIDLPAQTCPHCGGAMVGEGFDIAFEIFLGFKADKVPDIDLNFSGEYQARAMAFVEELFGQGNCFRSGTIGTLAQKTAYGCVLKWAEKWGRQLTRAEIDRLVGGLVGVKKTTGQHPGGMVIVPDDRSVYEFCPVQHPPKDQQTITTHYDFNSLHDLLVKIDVLGHADPTMLRRLPELTGIPIDEVPLFDAQVMSLFSSTQALGIEDGAMPCKVGTLGIPEFGTGFVRGMLADTLPTTFMELVRISGLSHGESVWLGNAQDLIREGTANLRDCICTRDDILTVLLRHRVDSKHAFDIMERVRKGKGLVPGDAEAMADAEVPEWFIESCRRIKYLFPRSHAAAYVTMGVRVAWYKVHRPLAYYAAFFSIRAAGFDAPLCTGDEQTIRDNMRKLEAELAEEDSPDKERKLSVLESVLEMRLRGIAFLPVDLHKSTAEGFLIEDGNLRLPFGCLPKLGENAALQLEQGGKEGPYKSVEELRLRTKINSAVITVLREYGCLKGLSDTSQLSFLDMLE